MTHHEPLFSPIDGATQWQVSWLGQGIGYTNALTLQRRLVDQRADGVVSDTLLLLEHAPVYTRGRRAPAEHVLLDAEELSRLGVPLVTTDRGGQVTYHGPGQLVGYPIISLAERRMGPRAYVCALEQALAMALAEFGIDAHASEDSPGIWAGGGKIAAIGVKVSRGVAHHGFALNVDPDLAFYSHIIPCGITDRPVTSMARLLGRPVSVEQVRPVVTERLIAALA